MPSITKNASVFSVAEGGEIVAETDPTTGDPIKVQTMIVGIILGRGTAGEQRSTFMVLESDYDALGRPGFGDAITVTLATG